MRVIGRSVEISECPPNIRAYVGQSFVTVGKEYEVHALAIFDGIVMMQIVDDVGMPSWRPGWLFETLDGAMASDWICNAPNDGPISLLVGPPFVVQDEASYTQMVELETDQVARFWKRIDDKLLRPRGDDPSER